MVTLAVISGSAGADLTIEASAARRAGSRFLAGGLTGRAVQAVDGESGVWSGEPPHDQGGGGPRHREAGRVQYGGAAAAVAATVRMGRAFVVRMVRALKRALGLARGVGVAALPVRLAVRRERETSHGQEHCQQESEERLHRDAHAWTQNISPARA
jgi:hypothetical protein